MLTADDGADAVEVFALPSAAEILTSSSST